MSDLADVPYDQFMETCGREHRRNILKGLIIYPDSPYFLYCLKQTDKWFRDHGIDPEEIQLGPSGIANAEKEKKRIGLILEEAKKREKEKGL